MGSFTTTIDGVTKDTPAVTPPWEFVLGWVWNGPEIEVDWARYRTEWRLVTDMKKYDFVAAIVADGVLPSNEAPMASRGEWPPTFDSFLVGMPTAEVEKLKSEWGAATSIRRSHPMLDPLGASAGRTPEQVDDIFGYDGQ